MDSDRTEIWKSDINQRTVRVFYVEFEGGGICYEYKITDRASQILKESDNGYGSQEAAAAGAFTWLAENNT